MEIGKRLTIQGNCPADFHCSFAGADGCFAPADILEEKLTEAEKTLRENERGLVVRNTLKPSQWPCNDLIVVVFVNSKVKGGELNHGNSGRTEKTVSPR